MKTLRRLLAGLFVLLLFLPILERQFHIFPEARLYGVERSTRGATFTWKGWWDGAYQRDFERRLTRRFGLRGHLVKTFNEIRFTIFRETDARAGTRIVIGRNGWLYDRNYVLRHGAPAKSAPEKRRQIVEDLRRLQEALSARGIAFAVVLAPTKVTLYPENAPSRLLRPPEQRGPGEYDEIRPLLEAAGVRVMDGVQLLLRKKEEQPHPLFSKTGTHWNYLAAGFVVEELTAELRRQTGKNLPILRPVGVEIDRKVFGSDNDLGQLLNIWRTDAIAGPQVHPRFAADIEGEPYRPNILFVGDSFVHTLTRILDDAAFYRARDTFYYFKRRFSYPTETDEPLDGARFDWRQELLERDAVVLEICEYWLPNIGFGFVGAALNFLEGGAAAAAPRAEGAPDDE